jgi:RNA polymerase sigma-70 factor (ECF subfamily)
MSTLPVFTEARDSFAQELEELFRKHARFVYRTAYSVTGSAEDAEDVVQNLFLHLLRKGYPPGLRQNPKAYLYRSAVNQALNALKSRKKHSEDELLDVPASYSVRNDEGNVAQYLVNAMAQLHPRAVEMLILRYEHDYSDAEIGKLLGKSRGVVAVTMYRARARLKRLLTGGTL